MKKTKFFTIREINKETKNEFKTFLRETKDDNTIEIFFDCWGGNAYYGMVMEAFIYYIKKKYSERRFIMKATVAASAAFRIFIRGHERIITKKSIIQPHLPEPNDFGKHLSLEAIGREQAVALKMITVSLPLVERSDIIKYNDFPLPLEFMIAKRVVTQVVSQL